MFRYEYICMRQWWNNRILLKITVVYGALANNAETQFFVVELSEVERHCHNYFKKAAF
jgi:hypothetical protein